MLGGCGMDTKKEVITKAIESYLQEKYGEEFEVLSWNQPKLFHQIMEQFMQHVLQKVIQNIHLKEAIFIQKRKMQK